MQKSPNLVSGKSVLKARRTVPRGFYAKVEDMANLDKGEASTRFNDDSSLPKGSVYWNQYLERNFDQIYQEFQESARAGTPSDFLSALTMHSPMSAASPSATSPMSMVASPSADIPMLSEDVPEELETEETDDENYAVYEHAYPFCI
ncbi:hypothetical protein A0J61_06314 [Choanephora cucurbitarum]|uniref:Uncharacterized protein n=1 Tax=Choanephora cucurbitarum TaxID=101091 RepID=A0A1C7N975_9FUNG|nr:hypothetical protein A0J61_06314 [Choanephora cucurbitarum]